MKKIAAVFFILVMPSFFIMSALYAEPAKLNTDDAGAVKPGDFEVEFAYAMATGQHVYDSSANRETRGRIREHTFDWSAAAGITDRVELNAAIGYADLLDKDHLAVHGNGWNDIELGSKIELLRNKKRDLILTYAPSVVIPSGRENRNDRLAPGGDSTVLNQRAIATKNWRRWNASVDTGYGLLAGSRNGQRGSADVNFAFGYQLCAWFHPEMEFHYAHNFLSQASDSDQFAMTWGAVMPVHERLRVISGVRQVLAGRNTDQEIVFSVVTTLFL